MAGNENEKLIDLTEIHSLMERYPFTEEEIEILVRCFEHVKDPKDRDDFLLKLARASPYQYFFLPGDEMQERVNWIEDHILPAGFANELRAAVSVDAFVEYANQGEDKPLERFLEGVADTGRRGSKEALRLMYRLIDQPEPKELMDISIRLAVASETLVIPKLDKKGTMARMSALDPAADALSNSLTAFLNGKALDEKLFVQWAEQEAPMVSTPLSTFVHGLLFHGHPYPKTRIPFEFSKLDKSSNIFEDPAQSPDLLSLSMVAPQLGGKWHGIYSSFLDGRSFYRLQWALLGYSGPTVLVVKTTTQTVLGAFTTSPWKESKHFYGNSDCFLFEMSPKFLVHRAEGGEKNFMYLHSDHDKGLCAGHPHGLAFGGSLDQPRFFIPESFEKCKAGVLDKTFRTGELVPFDDMEAFEIQVLEVWGVGGEDVIKKALDDRAQHRQLSDEAIERARVVHDKTQFVADLKSDLIPNTLYDHQKDVRGRQEFHVDDKHGGYKLEH